MEPPNERPVNYVAIGLAVIALAFFFAAILSPCIEITDFGREQFLSLLGGIKALWSEGHIFLSCLIFLFTILFPPAKLIATLLITVPLDILPERHKTNIHRIISHLGKWSLLDVLVIAILVVAIKVHGLVSIRMALGTYLFATTVLMSMLAAHFIEPRSHSKAVAAFPSIKVRLADSRSILSTAVSFQNIMLLAVILAVAGGCLLVFSPSERVEAIRVTKRDGLITLPHLFGNPSYYVVVRTLEGPIRLETKQSTPIGNGLTWQLSKPVSKSTVIGVDLFDSGWLSNSLVDRVDLSEGNTTGQHFQFQLDYNNSTLRFMGAPLLILGFLCGAVAAWRKNRAANRGTMQRLRGFVRVDEASVCGRRAERVE